MFSTAVFFSLPLSAPSQITVCMIEVCFRVCSRGTKKSLRSVKPQGEQPPQDQTPIESVKEGYAGGEEMEGKDGARQRIKGDL